MICVDATVLIDLFVGEPPLKGSAASLLAQDAGWVSSSLWRYEVTHVLGKYVRLGKLDEEMAWRHLRRAEALVVETVEVLELPELLSFAAERQLTGYDASYAWVAKKRNIKLRTRDEKILENCAEIASPMPPAAE